MISRLFALAFAAGLVMPSAAQAQLANVRLYGSLNLDLELIRGKQPDGSNPTINRVSSNSSRLGIRGLEYLGGGQVAVFQIESSINGDTNAGNLGGRETFVGLQGAWGTVKLGRFLTPYDDIHPIFGNVPTLSTSILSTASLWAQGPLAKGQGGFDARLGNSLRYDSPNLNGFSAEIQYSTRDSSGNASGTGGDNGEHVSELRHANVWSVGAFYSRGSLDLGAAYERNNKVRAEGFNDDALSIAAAYDFGMVMDRFGLRIGGIYERLKYATTTGDLKRDFYGISGTLVVGAGVIYAFWGRANNGKGSAVDGTEVGGLAKGPDSGSTQWELSYSHNLSPRTMLYAGYVRLSNEVNARYTFNINDYTTAPGAKLGGAVFGIAHFF